MPLPNLKSLIAGGVGEAVKKIGDTVREFVTTKKDKMEHEQTMTELDTKIQEIANLHIEKLNEQLLQETEAYLKDTQNAREQNVQIQLSDKASWWAKNTAYFLDIFLGLIWGTTTIFLLARALKLAGEDADLTAVLSIYSTVTAVFMICLNFHRGTSKSSQDKQGMIEKMLK